MEKWKDDKVEAVCSRLKVEKRKSVTQRREVDRWRGREVVVKQRFRWEDVSNPGLGVCVDWYGQFHALPGIQKKVFTDLGFLLACEIRVN